MLKHLRTQFPLLLGILVLFVGVFAGEHYALYRHIPHFDKALHFLGGLAVGWMAMAFLQDDIKHLAGWKQLLIITAITAFVGLVWEFAEYLANGLQDTHPLIYRYYHGGDLHDTLIDLFADIVGSAFFAFWALWKEKN